MHIRDVTRYDIIKIALEALPHCEEGDVIVVVDVRDGSVEVLTKTYEFEDWARNFDNKKVIFHLKEEEANKDIDSLFKKHKFEICCTLLELKEEYPHLKIDVDKIIKKEV